MPIYLKPLPILSGVFLLLTVNLSQSFSAQSSDLLGSLSVLIEGGSEANPNHVIISPSVKGKAVFRGQVKGSTDNNVSFYKVPDLLDPTTLANPFKPGIFISQKARAVAVLSDNNFTIDRISMIDGGSNYLSAPDVFIRFPTFSTDFTGRLENAYARADLSGSQSVVDINVTIAGNGYVTAPEVQIEGGPHFITLIDSDSNLTGKFYRIVGNSGDQLTLENSFNEDLGSIFTVDAEVEIFEAWTLGELLGYQSTSLNMSAPHDYVYLLDVPSSQNGGVEDFEGFLHDGTSWKRMDSPSVSADHQVILPNQSFVVARRSPDSINLQLSGTALSHRTYIDIPETGKRGMLSNPYSVDLMLSDLVDTGFITDNNQSPFLWLSDADQEKADNVQVLRNGVWSTYWHDGKNRSISRNAFATARAGSGPGASLMQRDISLAEGIISNMTNPTYESGEFIEVFAVGHGLRSGFTVKISGASGYKTNSQKQLVNELGEVVEQNSSALIIQSGANGLFEISDVTFDSFKLSGKAGDCNFIPDGNARWSTGFRGLGYEYDCTVSFIGGGGSGAKGIAKVDSVNNRIESISITERGSGYIEPPKVVIHGGGWRKVGAGNSPFNDLLIPAGSGIMVVRNNPSGEAVRFPVRNPFE